MLRWRRPSADSELEAMLRSRRPEAPEAFVESLARRVQGAGRAPRRVWSRAAFAAAVSVLIVGSFASLGGLSYANSGLRGTYSTVKQIVVKHKLVVSVHTSSAAAQYPHQPKKKHAVAPARAHAAKPAGAVAGVNAVKSGTLPFTGLSLLATFLVSLALIATGVVLRRRERRG